MISVSGRETLLQVAFQDALAQMHRLGRVARLPFGIFAHVQQHHLGILPEPRARLVDGDFVDARFGVRHKFEKTG